MTCKKLYIWVVLDETKKAVDLEAVVLDETQKAVDLDAVLLEDDQVAVSRDLLVTDELFIICEVQPLLFDILIFENTRFRTFLITIFWYKS